MRGTWYKGLVARFRLVFSLVATLGAICAGAAGCDGCGSASPPVAAKEAAAPLAAVPAPPGLLAEVVLATPDATWKSVQGTIGGLLALTAPTFAGMLGATAGAPGLSGPVEAGAPAYVVVGDGASGLHWAVALRANEAAALSWAGADAGTFVRSATDEEQMKIFEPVRPDGCAVGVAPGNFLVVASSRADLVALGPYAFRTLPTRPLPKDPARIAFTHDGVAKLVALGASEWSTTKSDLLAKDEEQRQAHGGRAPDHGDPKALVAAVDRWIGGWLDAGRDARSGELVLEALEGSERALGLELLLTANGPTGPAASLVNAMHPGEVRALEAAPGGAFVALEVRSDTAERAQTADDLGAGSEAVLRLGAAERKDLTADLAAWAGARGDELVLGFDLTPSRAFFLRTTVPDEARATKAFDGLVHRADTGSLRDLVRGALDIATLQTAPVTAPGVGSGTLVTVTRRAPKPAGDAGAAGSMLPPKLGVFYTAQRGELVATAAEDAPAAAAALLGGGKRLGDDARVKEALGRVHGRGVVVGVARPLLASAAPRSDAAIFAVGRDGDRAMLRLEATGTILRELMRRLQTEGP